MAKSRKKVEIIGVSGVAGSFSEEAARTHVARSGIKNANIVYLTSVENVLASLEEGVITTGIFPIENSNGGIVIEAVHAMSKHNFSIKKIFEIDIHMNLMVKKGVTAGRVRRIVSHDQALKQCRMYLKRRWPKVKLVEYPDTAKAAQDLAAGKLPASCAVIASRAAAALYTLDLLEESVQDLKFNFTTFVVATK